MARAIYYATSNKGKVNSLRREFSKYGTGVIQVSLDIPECRSADVSEIAVEKVKFVYRTIRKPVVASDAGFYIKSLNGFPMAFVNFALDTIGLEGLLDLTRGKNKTCEFRECLAYMDAGLTEPECFVSVVKGKISDEQRGEMREHLWSRLGLIFIPESHEKTLAEMPYEEYLKWRSMKREMESSS